MGCRCDDLYSCEFKAWLTLAFLCSLAEWLKCVVMLTESDLACVLWHWSHPSHDFLAFLYQLYIFFSRWPVRLRMNVMQKKTTKFNPMQYYNYWYFQRLFITLFSFQKKTEWKREVSSVLCQFQHSKRRFLVVIMLIMLEVGSYMRCTFLVCAEESKVIKKNYGFWIIKGLVCLFLLFLVLCYNHLSIFGLWINLYFHFCYGVALSLFWGHKSWAFIS